MTGNPTADTMERNRIQFPLWLKCVLFGAAYFFCAEASTLLSAKGSPDISFWLPAGLYVAVLLLHDYKSWPWLILAATGANVLFDVMYGMPVLAISLFVTANSVEAITGAWLVRKFVARRPTIATLREFVGLLFFAGVLSTFLGAAISATGQRTLGMSDSFVRSFSIWWGSTSMATLIVSPFVLAWFSERPDWRALSRQPKKLIEAAILVATLMGVQWAIFVSGSGIMSPHKAPLVAFLIWAGLRFGVRGATAVYLLLALTTGFLTQHYLRGLTPADLVSRDYVSLLHVTLAFGALLLTPAIVLAEHDRALEELRKSEERFQLAVRGSTDGIWDWNLLTNDVFYSDRYRELLGYSRAEFPDVFASFEAVLHPDDTERVLRLVETHLKRRTPHDVEFRLRNKLGEYRWFRGRGQAIWNEGGRATRMAGSITDITVQNLQGQLLRESEEKFSKAFRSSPNGVAINELGTGRYIEVNDSYCRIHGLSREDLVGRTSVELGFFDSAADRERVIEPVRATGRSRNRLVNVRLPRGNVVTLLFSAERIDLGGQECMVSVLYDITARLQTEERLEQTSRQLRALTRRLQSLREEERTHLAREIHDHLGQLLTALSLDLRLIERRAAGVADAGLRAALQGKVASAQQLANETITSVQKIATELRPAILDRVGLEAAIESETQAFQARTGLECHCALPSAPLVLGSEQATGVFRIFQEILTNVARHAKASRLAVCLSQEEDTLLLEVEDNGVGIPPEASTQPTSLGLLGMKERAAILGGRITFGRHEKQGTTVVMEIPLNGKVEQSI